MNKFQLFWWHTPVSILTTMYDAVATIFFYDMLHPLLDKWIATLNSLRIAILSPQHIAAERQCCRPCHIVAIVVPECWGYVRNAAIRTLRLTNVTHPLGIEAFVVEQETLAQRAHRPITQPRLAFIALWTVNRHPLIVVQHTPPSIADNLVQYRIRTLKMSRCLHLISHHFSYIIVLRGILQSYDFGILKTMIDKCGGPPASILPLFTITDVDVCRTGIAEIVSIERAVSI